MAKRPVDAQTTLQPTDPFAFTALIADILRLYVPIHPIRSVKRCGGQDGRM